jgi:lipoprotein-anchoring transpeptidase ErfK/SrfK
MRYGLILLGLAVCVLGGSGQETLAPASQTNWTPRDRQLLANPPYAQAQILTEYQRHIVDYRRKEVPCTIVVDTSNRYLYYVLPQGKAIRYSITEPGA